jgi:hypothetical protein
MNKLDKKWRRRLAVCARQSGASGWLLFVPLLEPVNDWWGQRGGKMDLKMFVVIVIQPENTGWRGVDEFAGLAGVYCTREAAESAAKALSGNHDRSSLREFRIEEVFFPHWDSFEDPTREERLRPTQA